MPIDQLIEELAAAGIYLAVQDGKLVCKASPEALTPEWRQRIAEHKAGLIALLGSAAPRRAEEPALVPRGSGPAPLAPAQQRLWFLDQLTGPAATYAVPVAYRLAGTLDVAALEQAWRTVVARHESLRTVIAMDEGEPVALVREQVEVALQPDDLAAPDPATAERLVRERLQEALARPFDLARELPWRASLLRLAPDVHALVLVLHHIASDGWSVENLLRELGTLYGAFHGRRSDPLPPLTLQYGDYAVWQRQWLQGPRLRDALEYWRHRLEGIPPSHGLPLDRPRPARPLREAASWRKPLSPALHAGLLALGRSHGATLFMTLQAAFAVLLARWSGQVDVVFGTPAANRPRPELAPLIGFFANTLALRLTVAGEPTFLEVLAQARAATLEAFDRQHLPFDQLVEELNPPRSLSLAPVFQIMFSVQDVEEAAALQLPGIRAEAVVPDAVNAKFDLSVALHRTGAGMEACWDYSCELFDRQTVASLGESFDTLLQGIVANPSLPVGRLPLLDPEADARVAATGHAVDDGLPHEVCLHTLVERQVARHPDAPAVIGDGASFSYAELNRQANRLARHLRRLAVGPEVRVAVVMDRHPTLPAALLAVLKAGGAYVPMEPDTPTQRLHYLLTDSAAGIVLARGTSCAAVREALALHGDGPTTPVLVDLEADATGWAGESDEDPTCLETGVRPDHLAYVIYTSGSTGQPKGVMNAHRGVVNRLCALQRSHPPAPGDRILQKTPIGFDVSVREIFLTLLGGGTLVQARPDGHKDPGYLADLIVREQVTFVNFVPSMLEAFLEHPRAAGCRSIRHIFCGGEALPASLARRCRDLLPAARLHNFYGPTEAAISVTAWDCPPQAVPDVVPVGRPGANVRIYLLDPAGRPVPRGMRGEIHVGGVQVARGYFDRPALTAERFVPDPFSPVPGARMYRTGDLGRHLADGQIEYLGRNDSQVKIRGQRVELGEIEAQVRRCAGVGQAAVQVRGDGPGEPKLVAYLVPSATAPQEPALIAQVRRELQAQLPSHMLPAAYVVLARLPVTANGKLDTGALPPPRAEPVPAADHEAPRTPLEAGLAGLWEELLGHRAIDVTANFFDLGGHSLLLTRLLNRIVAGYRVELTLRQLFAAQTVREQAALVESLLHLAAPAPVPAPGPRPPGAPPVLSFAQRRLWFIDQMEGASAVYNIPCALRLTGPLEPAALHRALEGVVQRHQVLRTAIASAAGEARPATREEAGLSLPRHDLRELPPPAQAEAVRHHLEAEATTPFDLARDLMLRARLLRLADEEHAFLLTVHHIAADGWSMAVLLRDLADLYAAAVDGRPAQLPPLPLQYADYAHWQQQWLQGPRLDAQLAYWEKQLADLPTLHSLPLDFPRPEQQRHRGAAHRQRLPAALQAELVQLGRAHDATLFMTLQAAFAVLLARWSGSTDIVVGTPIANRLHEELAPLVGFFVNALVLRTDLSGNPGFAEVLRAARGTALDAYQHQDVPFEMLVDRLRPRRALGHGPLFQVMIALENNAPAIVPFGQVAVSDMAGDMRFSKFDLTLNLRETPDGLETAWEYDRDLFRPATVARMAASFETLLQDIVAAPDKPIRQLRLLERGEIAAAMVRGPELSLPGVAGVHERVAAVAAVAPATVAVRDGGESIDYASLNRRANRLAHALRALGIGPDDRVAIHTERSIDTVVALLGVLKAGGAYVPLDPAHPAERLRGILADCGAAALVTQQRLRDALAGSDVPRLVLDDPATLACHPESDPVVAALGPHHLAYVMYTSGSTGAPKGVMIEHGSLLNMVESCRPLLHDDDPVAAAWWASFAFDVSVFEILTTLAMGGTLHVVPEPIRVDVDAYVDWLDRHRITQAFLPPFIARRLRDCPDRRIAALALRRLWVGVEPLLENELHRIRRLLPGLALVNSYGPTEITFYCTAYDDIRELPRNAPIGRPVANTGICVLDEAMRPVPEGVVGEVYVTGLCVARGYLGQPARTAERFLPDADGRRMYRTGDLARWTAGGQLEFRGRSDTQVKLNGVRIEPGEIEKVLATHPEVLEAAVLVRADHGPDSRRLVAYVVARDGGEARADRLREYLARHLPPAMVPVAYVPLPALPLTVTGKLDPKALPAPPATADAATAHVAPAGALEQQLATLWCEVLQLDRVSVTADFFELGGHSLKAVLLMSRLRELTGRTLPIAILFRAPTIRALAAEVENHGPATEDSFVQLRGGTRPPLFVFHAAGGDVLCYQPLLRHLDPDIPVYGFHRSELASQRVPALRSIEQLADEYVARLLRERPHGPYYLAGWSSGGLLALEAAARLEAAGHAVAAVLLVDTMLARGTDLPPRIREAGLDALAGLSPQAACELMREFEPDLPAVLPRDGCLPVPADTYFDYLVAANQIGIDFHRPRFRLRAPVHYFGCTGNRRSLTEAQRAAGIQVLAERPVALTAFDAGHFDIMEEPRVADLGRAMAAVLAHCEPPAAPRPGAAIDRSPEALA